MTTMTRLHPSFLTVAREWLDREGYGGAWAGTLTQVSDAIERYFPGGLADFMGGEATIDDEPSMTDLFGDVIHAYTRADALADGSLVDVTETAREAGFIYPVAVTRAAWEDSCEWTEDDTKRKGQYGQSVQGRLWDVLSMARFAVRAMSPAEGTTRDRVAYRVSRIPRPGHGAKRLVVLVLHIGPGDDGSNVFTIMQRGES